MSHAVYKDVEGQSVAGFVPVQTLPENSDFYQVRAMGRRAFPECFNERFVVRFGQVASEARDYRKLAYELQQSAHSRGYSVEIEPLRMYGSCRLLWQAVCRKTDEGLNAAAELYIDVFVAAVLSCSISDTGKDVYV